MSEELSQIELWQSGAENWRIQEATFKPLYEEIITEININKNSSLLDIGCGTGFFMSLLPKNITNLTGIDISKSAINIAVDTNPNAVFKIAEMENLPFNDNSFDYIIANNSFQYSINFSDALSEIYRVLKPNGKIIISVWSKPSDCDAFSYFKVFYNLTNQTSENLVPFNLSKIEQVEELLTNSNFKIDKSKTVICPRNYTDLTIALKAILSSGPANKAIKMTNIQQVKNEVEKAIEPYLQKKGGYKMNNSFNYTIGIK